MNLQLFGVSAIELCNRYTDNSGQRRIRITSKSWIKDEYVPTVVEITLYGETEAAEALPHSSDFADHSPKQDEPHHAAQVDIEDYLAGTTAESITDQHLASATAELPAAQPLSLDQLAEIEREAVASELPDIADKALTEIAADNEAERIADTGEAAEDEGPKAWTI